MAQAVIGALRVSLGIDSAQFSAGLARAQSRLGVFSKATNAAGGAVTKLGAVVAGFAAGGAMGLLITRSIEAGSRVGDLAKRLGITAEAVQELGFAASQSGASQEAFVTAMTRMAASLGDAQRGSKEAQREFEALGLTMRDLAGKTPDEAFTLIAERISALEDPLQRNAALMKVFGRSGAEMAELVSGGAKGIRELRQEARKLGLVLSNAEIAKFKEAGDRLDVIGQAASTAGQKFAIGFLPALDTLAKIMTDPEFQEGARKAGENIGKIVKALVDNGEQAIRVAGALIGLMVGLRAGLAGGIIGAGAGYFSPEIFDKLNKSLPEVVIDKVRVNPDAAKGIAGGAGTGTDWGRATEDDMKRRLDVLRDALMTEREAEMEAYQKRLDDLKEFQDARMLSETEANRLRAAAEEQHRDRMIEFNRQAADRRLAIFSGYMGSFASVLESIGGLIGDEGKKQFEINKKLSIAAATVKGLEAVVSSYAAGARIGGPFLGAAFAAAAAAATAAQIAAISRQKYDGGGAAAVSSAGGSGAASAGATGGEGGVSRSIFISGINPSQFYSGKQVRELAEALIEYQRDGGKVVLA